MPGLDIFALLILLIIVQAQRMSVEHSYCKDEVPVSGQQGNKAGSLNTEGAPDVLMLGAVWCPRLQGRDSLYRQKQYQLL